MKLFKVFAVSFILVSMALLPVLAGVEIEVLWGTQTKGWGAKNAKTDGNMVEIVKTAEVVKVDGNTKTFCIWSGGRSVLCGNDKKDIVGEKLEAGKYTVLAGIQKGVHTSRVNVYLKYVD